MPFTPADRQPIMVFYRSPSVALEAARGLVLLLQGFYCAVLLVGIADRQSKGHPGIIGEPRCCDNSCAQRAAVNGGKFIRAGQ